jgi:cell division septum initiation protein DivIVA
VALDRQSIEKKDFPVGQHGYEPAAVDHHLTALADEIDEFKQAARQRSENLASSASEQVRAIVLAAETSAADIQRAAEEEAREIKADADREAHSIRQQASEEARESFGKVSEATVVMMQRLDSMESELNALIESLRTGSERLNAGMEALEGHVGEVGASLERPPPFQPDAPSEPEPTYEPPTYSPPDEHDAVAPAAAPAEAAYEPPSPGQDGDGQPLEQSVDAAWGEPSSGGFDDQEAADPSGWGATAERSSPAPAAPEPAAAVSDDTEGARLIALNMALNGTPRDETARYLGENFQLPDRDGLLDEVYSSIED